MEKNYHLPFFPKFREKVLKNPAKRAQVIFSGKFPTKISEKAP